MQSQRTTGRHCNPWLMLFLSSKANASAEPLMFMGFQEFGISPIYCYYIIVSVLSIFKLNEKANELELYPLNNLSIHSCSCSLECNIQEFLDTWLTSPPWETGATGCFDKAYHKTLDKERRCWCCSSGITCTRSQTNTTFYSSSPIILSNSIC